MKINKTFTLLLAALSLTVGAAFAQAMAPAEGNLLRQVTLARAGTARARAFVDLARWYAANKDSDKAIATYQKALQEKPRRRDAYDIPIAIGDLYLQGRQYAQAIEYYQNAAALLPQVETAHVRLAAAYEQSELFELARQEYLGVLKANRRSYDANFGLASLYLAQGLNGPAMECYRQALLLRPASCVYRQMSCCAENTGDLHLAAAMLMQIISADRTYEDDINLGRLFEELKKYRESEDVYSQAIKRAPEKVEGYLVLGLLYLKEGNFTPSEKLLQLAHLKLPDAGIPHFFLGTIYFREHNYSLARTELNKAQELARSEVLKRYCQKSLRLLRTAPEN